MPRILTVNPTTTPLPATYSPAQTGVVPALPAHHPAWGVVRSACERIPNGVYQLTYSLGPRALQFASEQYEVRTSTRGQLAGQRVLWREGPDTSDFHPFATLMDDGRVWIWSRFANERGGAAHLVLNAFFRSIALSDTITAEVPWNIADRVEFGPARDYRGTGRLMTARCVFCNRSHTRYPSLSEASPVEQIYDDSSSSADRLRDALHRRRGESGPEPISETHDEFHPAQATSTTDAVIDNPVHQWQQSVRMAGRATAAATAAARSQAPPQRLEMSDINPDEVK